MDLDEINAESLPVGTVRHPDQQGTDEGQVASPREHFLADDLDRDLGFWPREKLEADLFEDYPDAELALTWDVIEQYRRVQHYLETGENKMLTRYRHPESISARASPAKVVRIIRKWSQIHAQDASRRSLEELLDDLEYPSGDHDVEVGLDE